MTIDQRIEFISRTDEMLNSMARILEHHEYRISDLEGGARG